MGRKIRTLLPDAVQPEWPDKDQVRMRDSQYQERMREGYDRHHGTQTLPTLHVGDAHENR